MRATLVLLLATLASPALAQTGATRTISGVVRDTLGAPVAGVEVRAPFGSATSAADGRFSFSRAELDSVRVYFRRIGFEPTVAMLYRAGVVRGDSNVVTLLPLVQRLDRVIVEGVPYDRELWERGFYNRRHAGQGRFFDPEEVRIFGASGLPAMLHATPRIRLERVGTQEYAIGSIAGRSCRMHTYVNGMYQYSAMVSGHSPAGSISLREVVHPDDIHAVEVYPNAATVPTQFARKGLARTGGMRIPSPGAVTIRTEPVGGPEAPCGVIVIWTKPFVNRANAERAKQAAKAAQEQ